MTCRSIQADKTMEGEMRYVATAAGFALALTAFPALAEDAKPNDAQIAHIA